MHDDFHLVPRVPEEVLRVLVADVPGVVVPHLGDDVPALKNPIGGGPEPYLRQGRDVTLLASTLALTLVTMRGAFASAPPTRLKPHGAEGEFLRNVTSSSRVLPPIWGGANPGLLSRH